MYFTAQIHSGTQIPRGVTPIAKRETKLTLKFIKYRTRLKFTVNRQK